MLGINHLFWMLEGVATFIAAYRLLPPHSSLESITFWEEAFQPLMLALATLLSFLINGYILTNLAYTTTTATKCIVMGCLFIVHIALFGYYYTIYPLFLAENYVMYYDNYRLFLALELYYDFVSGWSQAVDGVWLAVLSLFDTIVSLLVTFRIVGIDKGTVRDIIKRCLQDKWVIIPIACQVVVLALYSMLYCIIRYSVIPGSDRNLNALKHVMLFTAVLHCIISCFSYDYFAVSLEKAISAKKGRQQRMRPHPKKSVNANPLGNSSRALLNQASKSNLNIFLGEKREMSKDPSHDGTDVTARSPPSQKVVSFSAD
ncbi:hypothetical protein HDU91_005076 [Kappamyces sp. JEL0680]|nr:hypothetical protein HDU91_005076 [Kappamyces sp. JEL0680]